MLNQSGSMFQGAVDPLSYLYPYEFLQLTTFRKDGRAVKTTIWFAADQGKLYVMTTGNAGKIKRIRNSSRVTLAPCNRRGEVLGALIEARAHELPPNEFEHAMNLLKQKYGWLYRLFLLLAKARKVQLTFIEIEPGNS